MPIGLEDQLNITAADKEALVSLFIKFSEYGGSGDGADTVKDFILKNITVLMRMVENLYEQETVNQTMMAISKVVDLMQEKNAIREIDAQRKNGFAALEQKRSFHN